MLQTTKDLLMLVEVSDTFLFEEEKGENMGKWEKEDIPQCLYKTSRNTPSFPGGFLISRVPVQLLSSGQFGSPSWSINDGAGIS